MIRWLHVVLPRAEAILALAVAIVVLVGGARLFELHLDRWVPIELRSSSDEAAAMLLLGAAATFGAWRALGNHPLVNPGYHSWLILTPWNSQKPLPLGPVHLVRQDAVIVGTLLAISWASGTGVTLRVPQVFLGAYLVCQAWPLFATGSWPWAYAVLFGLGASVYFWSSLWVSLGIVVLLYPVAYRGLAASLARFPWELPARSKSDVYQFGWPFWALAPRYPGFEFQAPVHHALLISALIAWAEMAGISLMRDRLFDQRVINGRMLLAILLVIAPIVRIAIYCSGHWPPISFLGRLFTFRWIIPGYDRVFVAPLLALFVGVTLDGIGVRLDWPYWAWPAISFLVLAISLGLGPTWQAWRLTGEHRIGSIMTLIGKWD